MHRNETAICIIADSNYLKYTAFLVHSLKKFDQLLSNIFILTIDVTEKDFQAEFNSDLAKQIMVNMDKIEKMGVQPQGHVSIATYAKLLIGDLIPNNFYRCLYLDVDILPLRSIRTLLEFPLHQDIAATQFANGESKRLFGTDDATYFSAGLMLLDLDAWRTKNHGLALEDLLRQNPVLFQGDNDLFNILFREKWQVLPPSMNYMVEPLLNGHLIEASFNPMIIHFVGPRKPWTTKGRTSWHKIWRDQYEEFRPGQLSKAISDGYFFYSFLRVARNPALNSLKKFVPYQVKESFRKFGEKSQN
jgi:lipopolysaccharide biosynthesis glycosyltransferase